MSTMRTLRALSNIIRRPLTSLSLDRFPQATAKRPFAALPPLLRSTMPRAPKSQSGGSSRSSHSSQKHRHRPRHAATPQQPASQLHQSTFASYSSEQDSWLPHLPTETSWTALTSLTLLTLNTWSSAPSHSPHQSLALYSLLQHSHADIIALQEVTQPFWDGLTALLWVREIYASAGGGTEGWWGVTESASAGGRQRQGAGGKKGAREAVIMLVKKRLVGKGSEAGVKVLGRARDEGGKGWLEVRLRDGDGRERVRIATSHFSSLPANASLRQVQYRAVLSSLHSPSPSPSASSIDRLTNSSSSSSAKILLGDFNASSSAEFSVLTSAPYGLVDALLPSPTPHGHHPHPPHLAHPPRPPPPPTDAFLHPPTFGHLYPYVPGAPRSKPRKARRIDRVYFSPSSSSSTPSLNAPSSSSSAQAQGQQVRCTHYSHLGDSPLRLPAPSSSQHSHAVQQGGSAVAHQQRRGGKKGPKIRDRDAVDGWMRASDHSGVRVVLEGV